MDFNLSEEGNQQFVERLQGAIETVIKKQIKDKEPPGVELTLKRLQSNGFTEKQAYNLVGQLVGLELAEILHTKGEFNRERYMQGLDRLPFPFIDNTKSNKK